MKYTIAFSMLVICLLVACSNVSEQSTTTYSAVANIATTTVVLQPEITATSEPETPTDTVPTKVAILRETKLAKTESYATLVALTPSPTPTLTNTPRTTLTPRPTLTPTQTSIPTLTRTPDPCKVAIETVRLRIPDPYTSKLHMATAAFSEYLRQFTLCPPSSVWVIDDYEILQARLVSQENRVDFYFSVKPSQYPSPFIAGNGIYNDETGWIEAKYQCYDLVIGETYFYLTGGWTMC